jgi:hypothetical protein
LLRKVFIPPVNLGKVQEATSLQEGFRKRLAEEVAMISAAIVLGLAALGGLTLAGIRISGAPRPPTWLAVGHGLVAATGVGLLIYAAVTTGLPTFAQIALGVFVLAALGGATLFLGFHLREKALPIPLVIGHGLVAVTGYALLLMSIFS